MQLEGAAEGRIPPDTRVWLAEIADWSGFVSPKYRIAILGIITGTLGRGGCRDGALEGGGENLVTARNFRHLFAIGCSLLCEANSEARKASKCLRETKDEPYQVVYAGV